MYTKVIILITTLANVRSQYVNSNTNNNPNCANICAQPQSTTTSAVSSGCVCPPGTVPVMSQSSSSGASGAGSGSGGSSGLTAGWNNTGQPGYLPNYCGDNYTNPQRIQDTRTLNAPFFQSIGGEPKYVGGVPPNCGGQFPGTSSPGSSSGQSSSSQNNCQQCSPAYMQLQPVIQRLNQQIQQAQCNAQTAVLPTTTCAPVVTQPLINCCKV